MVSNVSDPSGFLGRGPQIHSAIGQHGDSGGPAFTYENGKFTIFGLTSTGDGSYTQFLELGTPEVRDFLLNTANRLHLKISGLN